MGHGSRLLAYHKKSIQHIAEMNELKLGPSVESIAVSLNGNVAAIGTADGTDDGMIFLVDRKQRPRLDCQFLLKYQESMLSILIGLQPC